MTIDRGTRARTVEYKINFLQKKREVYVYIGSTWAGRIIHKEKAPLQKEEGYGTYLQLPGMWGPVAYTASLSDAKIEASRAIQRWLTTFTGYPADPEERPEPLKEVEAPVQRVTRTRPTPSPVAPITRVRRTR